MLETDKAILEADKVDAVLNRVDELLGAWGEVGLAQPAEHKRRGMAEEILSGIRNDTPLAGVRVPFPVMQRVAFQRDERLPDESEFFAVQCHDLAPGGVSLLMESAPPCNQLVVAMGKPPAVAYMTARVAHCTEVILSGSRVVKRGEKTAGDDLSDAPGRPMVLVGCAFTGRISAG